jgi:integrase
MERSSITVPQASTAAQRPAAREMAFVRACVEGVDPAQAWVRFLADERHTAHPRPRQVLRRLLDELRSLARAHGRPEVAALLGRHPTAARGPARDRLSLDEYRDQRALDFYTEAEVADLYQAEFGGSNWRDPTRRRDRLRARLLEALQWLGSVSIREPLTADPVASWFDSVVAARLATVGVDRLGDLMRWIGLRGFRWHRPIRGIGPLGAARIVRWLHDHEPSLGALPVHALRPDRQIDKTASTPAPRTGIVPLERFIAPPQTDGSHGSNRASPDRCQINAANDAEAVRAWLAQWPAGTATWRAYRREAERFLLWAVVERHRALSSLDQGDCAAYRQFIAQPGLRWTAPRRTQRWSDHWRPFEGPLAARSATLAVSIIGAMFGWLIRRGYLHDSPWASTSGHEARRAKGASAKPALRALSDGELERWRQWLDSQSPCQAIERLRFIVDFAALTGLRRSELAAARLGDLLSISGKTAPSTYRLRVASRRASGREVPLSAGAVRALQTHLRSRGLSIDECPAMRDEPLVQSLESGHALGAERLYEVVSGAMKRCAADLAVAQEGAGRCLSTASIHWLRHSCGVGLAASGARPAEVQQLLGHARAATIRAYFADGAPAGGLLADKTAKAVHVDKAQRAEEI